MIFIGFPPQSLLGLFQAPWVWVMGYDSMTVPFYQKSIGNSARNADLLLGIGETVGCGERWANGTEVSKALKLHGVPPEDYEWYVKMKENYPLQTSGFGMGIERFLLFILGGCYIYEIKKR